MLLFGLCFAVLLCVDLVPAAKILAVFPITARSHHRMFNGVLRALAERGHEVVSYTSVLHDPVPNYTEIQIDGVVTLDVFLSQENLTKAMKQSPFGASAHMLREMHMFLEQTFDSKTIQSLIQSEDKFDVMLCECLLGQEALLGLGHKFKVPVINVQTFNYYAIINAIAGNDLSTTYIPETSFPYTDHMTFYERSTSSLSVMWTLYEFYNNHLPRQEAAAREAFQDPTMPPLLDMARNISLFINNERPNVFYSHPLTPNIVNVGGIHVATERKPLPKDLKRFFDEAQHGVIYISMGSVVPDENLSAEYFQKFISVFRRLPQQRFLWKTRKSLQGLPDNVMTSKWVPQQDVLAHPNLLLFMTHGGLMSTHEVLYAGVPVVCTPYFFDQQNNARFFVERGVGIQLLFEDQSKNTIYAAFTTIMNNRKYRENMRRLSHIYRDQPMTPQQTAVNWVEYVIRHRGAPHLRPASTALTWYQLYLLDVLVVVLLVVIGIVGSLRFIVQRMLRILRSVKYKKTSSNKKNR